LARARAISELPAVRAEVAEATKAFPRARQAYEALKWELARDPHPPGSLWVSGPKNPLLVYRQAGSNQPPVPAIEVFYVLPDDDHLEIAAVRFFEPRVGL